jgi:hypothetical protein
MMNNLLLIHPVILHQQMQQRHMFYVDKSINIIFLSFKQQLIMERTNEIGACILKNMFYGYIIKPDFSPFRWYFFFSLFINWLEFSFSLHIPNSSSSSERRERLLTNRLIREKCIVTDFTTDVVRRQKLFFYFSCFVYNIRVRVAPT